MPALAVPRPPWFDMEAISGTYDSNREKDALVQREIIHLMAGTFLGEAGNGRIRCADLRFLPRMYIQVGHETLLDAAAVWPNSRAGPTSTSLEIEPQVQYVHHFLVDGTPGRVRPSGTWPPGSVPRWDSPDRAGPLVCARRRATRKLLVLKEQLLLEVRDP